MRSTKITCDKCKNDITNKKISDERFTDISFNVFEEGQSVNGYCIEDLCADCHNDFLSEIKNLSEKYAGEETL